MSTERNVDIEKSRQCKMSTSKNVEKQNVDKKKC